MIYRVVFVRFYDIKYYSSILAIGMENCRLLGNCTTEFACFWTPPKITIAGFYYSGLQICCPAINELLTICFHEIQIRLTRTFGQSNQYCLFFNLEFGLVFREFGEV